jgi:protein-S-isoprenylcysteine O-methyltransferase Ste14
MSLHEVMVRHGHTLFRWRSYIPLLLAGPLLIALKEAAVIEDIMGGGLEDIWVLLCFLLSLFGLSIRWLTVGFVPAGTSGRNTQGQRAETLNTTGVYSIVRNPLYLGNFLTILGVVLSIKVWWLVLMVSMFFFIYMERIILAEESFLSEKYGEQYNSWREKTPVIIPDFKNWVPPALPFSLRTVLRREYQGLLGMVTAFFVTEIITDLVFEHEAFSEWVIEDAAWPALFALTLVFCLSVRYLKKHTDVLKVAGR